MLEGNPGATIASEPEIDSVVAGGHFQHRARKATLYLVIATLAWAPFPLGSAAGWGTGLSILLVAICWASWAVSVWPAPEGLWAELRPLRPAGLLLLAAMVWAGLQIFPFMPQAWTHPLWKIAAAQLGRPVGNFISINPWHSLTEIAKLASCFALGWVAYCIARQSKYAYLLLDAVIYIAVFYALYGFILAFLGRQQVSLFYEIFPKTVLISGPFMLHNSFATYEGIGFLAAFARLVSAGGRAVNFKSGARPFVATLLHFLTGDGAGYGIAVLLTLAAVAASASRAGFASLAVGTLMVACFALAAFRLGMRRTWPLLVGSGALLAALFYVLAGSGALGDRYGDLLVDPALADQVRPVMWNAAWRMITDAPWLGLGLGTFQDAYPLYGSVVLAYIADKAHCDYLELAAGLGVPAALSLLAGLGLLVLRCMRGAFLRRRNQVFCLVAAGASVLVALHSAVDFSLQIPAVALQYSAVLGLGVAQSIRRGS